MFLGDNQDLFQDPSQDPFHDFIFDPPFQDHFQVPFQVNFQDPIQDPFQDPFQKNSHISDKTRKGLKHIFRGNNQVSKAMKQIVENMTKIHKN